MKKQQKQYFQAIDLNFLIENPKDEICFGCGNKILKGLPIFSLKTDIGSHSVCWKCACLIKTNERDKIRQNEFDLNMANIHRKRWIHISENKNSNEILSFIFPDVLKIRFVSDQMQ